MRTNIWLDVQHIKDVISANKTRSDVIKSLKRSPTTSMYRRLRTFEREHNVDVSHYTPWNVKGTKRPNPTNRKLTSDQIFQQNSPVSQAVVRNRVIRDGLLPYVCNKCNNSGTWMGETITLQLEHKNGKHSDHRLNNLCFMCPNCHSQTSTYCGRNVSGKKQRATPRSTYLTQINTSANERNKKLVDRLTSSNIDITVRGWKTEVASLLGIPPQRVKRWMLRYCPEIYYGKK